MKILLPIYCIALSLICLIQGTHAQAKSVNEEHLAFLFEKKMTVIHQKELLTLEESINEPRRVWSLTIREFNHISRQYADSCIMYDEYDIYDSKGDAYDVPKIVETIFNSSHLRYFTAFEGVKRLESKNLLLAWSRCLPEATPEETAKEFQARPDRAASALWSTFHFIELLHYSGIVHGDLHTHNIRFENGLPKFIDFEEGISITRKGPADTAFEFAMMIDLQSLIDSLKELSIIPKSYYQTVENVTDCALQNGFLYTDVLEFQIRDFDLSYEEKSKLRYYRDQLFIFFPEINRLGLRKYLDIYPQPTIL